MQSDYVLLIALGLLLILSPLVKSLAERIGLPAPVGYLALGFALSVIDGFEPFMSGVFEDTFSVLAELGVVALLFRVGLRSRLKALLAKLPDASLIWAGDVSVNIVLGFALAYYVLGLALETHSSSPRRSVRRASLSPLRSGTRCVF